MASEASYSQNILDHSFLLRGQMFEKDRRAPLKSLEPYTHSSLGPQKP